MRLDVPPGVFVDLTANPVLEPYPAVVQIRTHLADQRRDVNRQWERLKEENLAIDRATATTLRHKFDAGLKLDLFAGIEGGAEKADQVYDLRNSIAYAREFALTRNGAMQVAATARHSRERMRAVRQALQSQPLVTRS